eukprot:scaffold478808_cov18-Prasinocladus_malaysianus.AAC.1
MDGWMDGWKTPFQQRVHVRASERQPPGLVNTGFEIQPCEEEHARHWETGGTTDRPLKLFDATNIFENK